MNQRPLGYERGPRFPRWSCLFVTLRRVSALVPAVLRCSQWFGLTCYMVATWNCRVQPALRLDPRTLLQVEDVVLADARRITSAIFIRAFTTAPTSRPWIRGGQRTIPAWGRPCSTASRASRQKSGALPAPPLAGSEGELLSVPNPDMPDFMGTDGVHAPLSQRWTDGGRQILIEVELHARRAIASRIARPSAWAAMSSAISASISCGNFAW